jgi:hypothetical protein
MDTHQLPEGVTVGFNRKDDAEWFVYYNRSKIGNVRHRFTPNLTYDAYRDGRLIYEGAVSLKRAAQALADFSKFPVKR